MSDQDVTAPDAASEGEGEGRPGPGAPGDVSPNKEIEGLRTGLRAERGKRQALEVRLAEVNGKLQGLTEVGQPRKAESESQISRAQLREKVVAGEITEAEAEQVWESQFERRLGQRIESVVNTRIGEAQTSTAVETQIASYREVVPDVMTEGSSARERVQQEYNFLTSTGAPDGVTTQLQALRAAFGPVEALKKIKGERPETHHQDVGSGTGGTDAGKDETGMRADGTPKGLTARQRDHYTPKVGPGKLYKDWPAVMDELKHQDKGLTQRRAQLP